LAGANTLLVIAGGAFRKKGEEDKTFLETRERSLSSAGSGSRAGRQGETEEIWRPSREIDADDVAEDEVFPPFPPHFFLLARGTKERKTKRKIFVSVELMHGNLFPQIACFTNDGGKMIAGSHAALTLAWRNQVAGKMRGM